MNLLLLLLVVAIGVLALARPSARNMAALKIGALAAASSLVLALVSPESAMALGVGALALVGLWLWGRLLLWPLHYLASLLHR
ncbi:hypothetical protein [Paenacidovorax caeni]|uniref:hypothetical protein n=1 Tax=Paenacidovorax caeni TaxID=343013 RepID=UPI0006BB8392|nr:hypothetical protein [Paenacidovorax caeni]